LFEYLALLVYVTNKNYLNFLANFVKKTGQIDRICHLNQIKLVFSLKFKNDLNIFPQHPRRLQKLNK